MDSILNMITKLKGIIPNLNPDKNLKTKTREILIKLMKSIKEDQNNNALDDDVIDNLLDILSKKKIDKKIKTDIRDKTEDMIRKLESNNDNIIDEINEEELVDVNDEYIISTAEKIDNIIVTKTIDDNKNNIVLQQEDLDALDTLLNGEITSYSKYTKKNPMLGITWNDKLVKWIIINKELKLNTKSVKLETATSMIIDNISIGIINKKKIPKIHAIHKIEYGGKKILIFQSIDKSLYDILHIINLIELGDSGSLKKYNEFAQNITHYGFTKNSHGGYILREFIPENIMFEIMMSGNAKICKNFKKHTSVILAELRQNNMLSISNDKIILNSITKETVHNNTVGKYFTKNHEYIQTYDNLLYLEMAKHCVEEGSKIIMQKYMDKHIMYLFIITLKDPDNHNRIFCKIGYTADIIDRIKTLRAEYKCEFYLIGLRTVKGERKEKDFHRSIKTANPELNYVFLLNTKRKDEIYIFDEKIIKEFQAIQEYDCTINDSLLIEKYIEESVKQQYHHFLKYAKTQKSYTICSILTTVNITKEIETVLSNLIAAEHSEYIRELDINSTKIENDSQRKHELLLKDHELSMKDREIRLKELDIEYAKLKNN